MENQTYRAAIAHAANLVGGVQELSDRLRIPRADLMRWISGEGKPTIGVFLRIIDLMIEQSKKPPLSAQKDSKTTKRPG